ncbi:acyl-CoA dehydrogenase [Sphingomonas sp. CARO-RG-8B-R24-01]|uniref:acyl-CoA dehydrogenase n=1 Tax=Sphingomonas sp. CARO-RG-8B-R24-01 TaxID=2914831 RepID=UPI001F5A410A|nr:acyl-CoA dehydrogenase [Sphingomonas sp. CARO-RG-8B-R24-01]
MNAVPDPLDRLLAEPRPTGAQMAERLGAVYRLLPVPGDPRDAAEMLALLRQLYRIARRDLPLARLFEGHVDALQILQRYDDRAGVDAVMALAGQGRVFGVWNAAIPDDPLRVVDGRLHGGKSFASGAGIVDYALAGADTPEGNRLLLIDLAASAPSIDRAWWNVIGMERSQTHMVRWDDAGSDTFRTIGAPGDYAREPYFSGGALRFVACHAGGVAALFDHVRDHLQATARSEDPHQLGRLADLYGAASAAADAVRTVALSWPDAGYSERVAAARLAVAAAAERAITLAQQAVGVSGMFVDHPLAAAMTDLMVYLRQPAPDAQRMRVGKAAASAVLMPDL